MNFASRVCIDHNGISADPEAKILADQLKKLGFDNISNVRVGKLITFVLEAPDLDGATATVEGMSEKFLANPVYEEFHFGVEPYAAIVMRALGWPS